MGLGGRLYNIWRGFLSIFISDLEKKNPKIAYENAIESMIEKHNSLKSAVGSLLKNRTRFENQIAEHRRNLERLSAELQAAVDLGDDETALLLIEQEEQTQLQLVETEEDLKRAASDAESAKASLRELETEINKLKRERDRVLAQIEDSEARKMVQDQLDGFSIDDEMKALDNVREYAEQVRAEVQVSAELKSDSAEGRLAKVRAQASKSRAQDRLADLKAKRQSQGS
jgi:phage shock protein A